MIVLGRVDEDVLDACYLLPQQLILMSKIIVFEPLKLKTLLVALPYSLNLSLVNALLLFPCAFHFCLDFFKLCLHFVAVSLVLFFELVSFLFLLG